VLRLGSCCPVYPAPFRPACGSLERPFSRWDNGVAADFARPLHDPDFSDKIMLKIKDFRALPGPT
jgi:hypothetical protein